MSGTQNLPITWQDGKHREGKYRKWLKRIEQIENFRNAIKSQADKMKDGWLDIEYPSTTDGRMLTLRVPRAPFEVWALRPLLEQGKVTPEQLRQKWLPISPVGFKMYGMEDDPCHTDWMLGAGLNVDTYEEVYLAGAKFKYLHCAIFDEVEKIQQLFGNFEVAILSGTGSVAGTVIHPEPGREVPPGSIVVLPSLRPTYFSIVLAAIAVITEAGGQMAHLAVVGREHSIPIVRVENARERFAPGMKVRVSCDRGRVEILED